MTAGDLVAALARRWYLVIAGTLASMAAAVLLHPSGVHWTQFELVLLTPANQQFPNTYRDPHFDLVPMASIIVTEMNHGHPPAVMGSSATTLFGEGLRSGSRVRLPNRGSQWLPLYPQPIIDVQVVGTDLQQVQHRSAELIEQARTILRERQAGYGIAPRDQITLQPSPADPITYFATGRRSRAAAATGLAGLALTIWLTWMYDDWRRTHTERRGRGQRRRRRSETIG